MSQSFFGSLVEMKTNIAAGFAINYTANLIVLPLLWDADKPALSAFYIGVVFTFISITRQLVIRRWFNRIKAHWNTEKTP